MTLIEKLIVGKRVTDKDLASALYDICETEHSGCSSDCPIYGKVLTEKQKAGYDCPVFKNGEAMLSALRKHHHK